MTEKDSRRLSAIAWLEIVLLPLAGLALAIAIFQAQPFTTPVYPWLWLIPLLLGLRYGLAAAALSTLTLALAGIITQHFGITEEASPLTQLVGGAFAALGAGQYRSIWRNQLQTQQAHLDYSEQRLDSLMRAFFITRLSHDRLEEALITQPVTLRSAMETLRELSTQVQAGISRESAEALLQLLAQYCRFDTVALYLVEDEKLLDKPLASLGPEATLARQDPLLVHALEHEQSSYYSIDQIQDIQQGGLYRAVIPLRDAAGTMQGILVVRDLPLLSLNEENLTVAIAIAQYFADESWAATQTAQLRQVVPHCPAIFAHELIKLQRLYVHTKKCSTLLVLQPEIPVPDVLDKIYAARRGLDLYWRDAFFGTPEQGMLILLPLAGPAGTRGFLDRIDRMLRTKTSDEASPLASFKVIQVPVDRRSPLELLQACGIKITKP